MLSLSCAKAGECPAVWAACGLGWMPAADRAFKVGVGVSRGGVVWLLDGTANGLSERAPKNLIDNECVKTPPCEMEVIVRLYDDDPVSDDWMGEARICPSIHTPPQRCAPGVYCTTISTASLKK